jgi:hypothetical protein
MLAKYTLRWKFYRTAAFLCNAPHYDLVREVVNPSKDHRLEEVASRHQNDPVEFKRVGRQLQTSMARDVLPEVVRLSRRNIVGKMPKTQPMASRKSLHLV